MIRLGLSRHAQAQNGILLLKCGAAQFARGSLDLTRNLQLQRLAKHFDNLLLLRQLATPVAQLFDCLLLHVLHVLNFSKVFLHQLLQRLHLVLA